MQVNAAQYIVVTGEEKGFRDNISKHAIDTHTHEKKSSFLSHVTKRYHVINQ